MTASNAPRRGQSVQELLYTAFAVFRATLLKCLPFAMIAVLCEYAPYFYWVASGHKMEHVLAAAPAELTPAYWWLTLAGAVIAIYIFSAMMLRQVYFSGGFAVNARQELTLAARRLPSLLVSWVLMQLTLTVGFVFNVTLGFVLLIFPGIFLFICYLVMLPVVLLEGQLNPLLALRRCVLLVLPNWWRVFAAFVIALLAIGVCALAFGAILGILAELLTGSAASFQAVMAAGVVAIGASIFVFFSALALAIHSSANSSA
jgi:hypothetical protein